MRRRRAGRDESGSASLLVLTMTGVLFLTAVAVTVAVAMVAAHRVAQSAADLSALAGAAVQQRGGDACGTAAEVAAANHAELRRCTVAGEDVTVEVGVPAPSWHDLQATLRARARAGPP